MSTQILKSNADKATPNLIEKVHEKFPIASIDFLVKLRDAAQIIVDAANEQLDQTARFDQREVYPYDPENFIWIRTEGQKGPYERYPAFQQKPTLTADYVNLLNDLRNHEGKMVRNGLFYWLWEDDQTIGRKPLK
jgi:hypothetical protein